MKFKRVILTLLVGGGILIGFAGAAHAYPPQPIDPATSEPPDPCHDCW